MSVLPRDFAGNPELIVLGIPGGGRAIVDEDNDNDLKIAKDQLFLVWGDRWLHRNWYR